MSTVKSLYDLDIASNSILNISLAPTVSHNCKHSRQLSHLHSEYRSKYEQYHAEKEHKLALRMMQLDHVIRSAVEFNKLLEKKE
jgi:hypothetical protein